MWQYLLEVFLPCSKENRYVKDNWKDINIEPFTYQATGIGPVGKSYDVFGDNTVVLVNTPGHTNGIFTTIVQNNNKFIALTSDSAYTQKSFDEKLIPGFTVNKKLARTSLNWLIDLQTQTNCLGIYANHDPAIDEQIIYIQENKYVN